MPKFTVTGDVDPFLHVALQRGETVYCESDAMVSMDATLDLKGKIKGGLIRGIMRKLANGESFFQQHIEAVRGDGECLLAPTLPGAMAILDCGPTQYTLSDGAFVAASSKVDVRVRTQSITNALFAKNGGFFLMETAGQGQVVVSGFGSMHTLDVEPGQDVVIDNSHLVAWDSALRYAVSVTTGGGGFLRNIVNSQTSGEGIVLRFSGRGKVLIGSRNPETFKAWVRPPKAG